MQRFFLALFLAWTGFCQAQTLPPLSFEQFGAMTEGGLAPYIADYFKRYPEQKGSEEIIKKFFHEHPPDVMMPQLQKDAPMFYAGIKGKAVAAQKGEKKSSYTLDDFLKLPEAEHRELAKLAGPYLYALLTEESSRDGLQKMVRKENRALEVAFMLVQMRAQQSTAEAFSNELAQLIRGLAQIRQATGPVE